MCIGVLRLRVARISCASIRSQLEVVCARTDVQSTRRMTQRKRNTATYRVWSGRERDVGKSREGKGENGTGTGTAGTDRATWRRLVTMDYIESTSPDVLTKPSLSLAGAFIRIAPVTEQSSPNNHPAGPNFSQNNYPHPLRFQLETVRHH